MIDMHVHILPGIDDGPETLEEALALAQMLVQDNVHGAVATPHYNDEYPQRSAAEIQGRVDDLQREFQRLSIPLRLFAGHEALIKPGLVEDIQYGRLATLNHSHYLLLELWDNAWLPGTERTLFELRACGIVPILAHPERCRVFQREPQRLAALLQQGVLTQLTASSLLGIQGQTARRSAESLLKNGLIHCIASDAHGARKRPPALSQSLKRATQLIGAEKVQKAVENYPLLIVNDRPYTC